MRALGLKGKVDINLVAVASMTKEVFVKKMKGTLHDPAGTYNKAMEEIKAAKK